MAGTLLPCISEVCNPADSMEVVLYIEEKMAVQLD